MSEQMLITAAAAAHAGFQLVVTAVVYPALAAVPAESWQSAHRAHTRRIAPVVGIVYVPLAAACLWTAWVIVGDLLDEPAALLSGGRAVEAGGLLVALLGAASSAALTAFGAARTHGRLTAGRDERLVRLLLRQDRWRCGAALLCLAGAVIAATAPSSMS